MKISSLAIAREIDYDGTRNKTLLNSEGRFMLREESNTRNLEI